MKKPNALAMIGNVVSEPAIIVIKHFNYTLTNVKVNLKKYMRNLNRLLYTKSVQKLKNGSKQEEFQKTH